MNLRDNLTIWASLGESEWLLLKWWYERKRPALVASKPSERHFPGSDRAYLLQDPSKCLDVIREQWNKAGQPSLKLAKVKAESKLAELPKGKPDDFGAFLNELGYACGDSEASWRMLQIEYQTWKSVKDAA